MARSRPGCLIAEDSYIGHPRLPGGGGGWRGADAVRGLLDMAREAQDQDCQFPNQLVPLVLDSRYGCPCHCPPLPECLHPPAPSGGRSSPRVRIDHTSPGARGMGFLGRDRLSMTSSLRRRTLSQ